MFLRLGQFVSRRPLAVILFWLAILVALRSLAPRWDDVTQDGDLAHLPANYPSVQGEKLLNEAFPKRRAKSQMVIMLARDNAKLSVPDVKLADELANRFRDKLELPEWSLLDVWSLDTEVVGTKLRSADQQAQLIILQFRHEFLAVQNIKLLKLVTEEIAAARAHLNDDDVHLHVEVSGSAAVGGDLLGAAEESIRNTEWLTVLLVVAILLVVYRAPLLVVVPLLTIVVSLGISLSVLALLTQLNQVSGFEWWNFKVFKTTKIFIVVILYGSGTDFCLFLIARFREELARGVKHPEAIASALGNVGDALSASALTTIFGLAMMFFADFGKFRNSGPAIGICLVITLLSCLTLAPALIRALGRTVLWPFDKNLPELSPTRSDGGSGQTLQRSFMDRFWEFSADTILQYPGRVLLASLLAMAPFVWHGTFASSHVTYDLLSELDPSRPSRRGTELLRQHYPVGEAGPIIVLAQRAEAGFGSEDKPTATKGLSAIHELTVRLGQIPNIEAVRSLAEPLGDPPKRMSLLSSAGRQKLMLQRHPRTQEIFLAQDEKYVGQLTRFELILKHDPFSREAVETLTNVDRVLRAVTHESDSFWNAANFSFAGTTAGIRDLRDVTQSDNRRIEVLVVLAVLAVLLVILRRPVVCLYLIGSVVLSYLVTIGATEMFFRWAYGDTFYGLDWKVPLFLFVILVAVGEDYNIYLATRVIEEQARLGPLAGLREATVRTGGIITSCGVIMAGTFVSMTSSTLRGMVEMGVALSLGILLDTFVVRPILVPAFLAILARRQK